MRILFYYRILSISLLGLPIEKNMEIIDRLIIHSHIYTWYDIYLILIYLHNIDTTYTTSIDCLYPNSDWQWLVLLTVISDWQWYTSPNYTINHCQWLFISQQVLNPDIRAVPSLTSMTPDPNIRKRTSPIIDHNNHVLYRLYQY